MGGCSALNCSNHSRNGFRLFSFPKDPERRKKWLVNCGREDWEPGRCAQLCIVHFEESQFELRRQDGWKRLKLTAVPTVFDIPNPPQNLFIKLKKRIGLPKPETFWYRTSRASKSEEMVAALYQGPVCGETTIKQELAEDSPLASPKQDFEEVYVKEEILAEDSPPASPKRDFEEIYVKEETLAEDSPLTSPQRDFEDVYVKEETLELRDTVEWMSNGCTPESSVAFCTEDSNSIGDNNSVITGHKAACQNRSVTKQMVHGSDIFIKPFSSLEDLKKHIYVDRYEQLHSCCVCLKTFATSGNLKRHVKLHIGERPYRCGICNKTFTQNAHLKRHASQHLDECPYSCYKRFK